MKYPNFEEEKKLWRRGYKMVVGVDEAGRGPLAGPVAACAFCFFGRIKRNSVSSETEFLPSIRDSKKLSAEQREKIYDILRKDKNIEWAIGRVSEKVIDKINILEATKLAMKKAVKGLCQKSADRRIFGKLDARSFLLIDGNFPLDFRGSERKLRNIGQKSIVKGDEKVFSCAAASIVAKVYRDRIMARYHKKYPQYGFDRHKGYPTEFHRRKIKEKGFCPIHRKTFRVS